MKEPYFINIIVNSRDMSCVLVDKTIKIPELENLLEIDMPSIYAEAQQAEIEEGLDLEDYDDQY